MTQEERPFVMVVGCDLSTQAEVALSQAVRLAQKQDQTDLHVLGVLDNRGGLGPIRPRRVDYASAEEVQEILRNVADKHLLDARSHGLNLYLHARIGTPEKEILALAVETDADMIVVGTHGRSGMGRLLLGSVAERVVRFARCPVLVARPLEHTELDDAFLPEPPCPQCVARREETANAVWWCDAHASATERPHIYSYRSGIAQKRPDYAPIL